jgi:hypothetical protein
MELNMEKNKTPHFESPFDADNRITVSVSGVREIMEFINQTFKVKPMTTNEDTPKPKLTFEQMKAMMKPYRPYINQVIVHKGTATKYRVVHIEFIESTMALNFSYHPLSNRRIVFSRPVTELTHERYEFPPPPSDDP